MHEQLENYLNEVRLSLRLMPRKTQNAEIEELREHMKAYAAALEELELTPDAAAAATIEQFGTPDVVGADIARTWRRGLANSLPGTALIAYVLQNGLMFLTVFIAPFPPAYPGYMYSQCAVAVLVGLTIGYRAPRYAIFGAAFPTLAIPFVWIAQDMFGRLNGVLFCLLHRGGRVTYGYNWPMILSEFLQLPVYAAVAVIAAKIGQYVALRGRRVQSSG